jgi:hypothetical protein
MLIAGKILPGASAATATERATDAIVAQNDIKHLRHRKHARLSLDL